jgi:hypothetical protein
MHLLRLITPQSDEGVTGVTGVTGVARVSDSMPPQSVWRVIAYLKAYCEDDGDLETDEASLYRHACELLAGRSPPPASVKISEGQFRLLVDLKAGSEAEIRAAAEWAFVLCRDLYGEDPPDGDVEAYLALTVKILTIRRGIPDARLRMGC